MAYKHMGRTNLGYYSWCTNKTVGNWRTFVLGIGFDIEKFYKDFNVSDKKHLKKFKSHPEEQNWLNPFSGNVDFKGMDLADLFRHSMVPLTEEEIVKNINYLNADYAVGNYHGQPGSGLRSSGFSADGIRKGIEGEEIFAKMLAAAGVNNYADVYYSLKVPGIQSDIDVDCVIATSNWLYLIDMKEYKQNIKGIYAKDKGKGKYAWEENSICMLDYITGERLAEYTFSRSMSMASVQYHAMLEKMGYTDFYVIPIIVMVLTADGVAGVAKRLMLKIDDDYIDVTYAPAFVTWMSENLTDQNVQSSTSNGSVPTDIKTALEGLCKDKSNCNLL